MQYAKLYIYILYQICIVGFNCCEVRKIMCETLSSPIQHLAKFCETKKSIYQPYIYHTSTIYLPDINHISTIYLPCVNHISTIYQPHIYHTSTIYLPYINHFGLYYLTYQPYNNHISTYCNWTVSSGRWKITGGRTSVWEGSALREAVVGSGQIIRWDMIKPSYPSKTL